MLKYIHALKVLPWAVITGRDKKKIPYDIVGSTIEKAVVTPFGLRTKGWFAWISGILVLKGIKIHWSCHPDKCIKAWGTLGMVD